METVQQNGRFTLFLVNSSLIYILFSLHTTLQMPCVLYSILYSNSKFPSSDARSMTISDLQLNLYFLVLKWLNSDNSYCSRN